MEAGSSSSQETKESTKNALQDTTTPTQANLSGDQTHDVSPTIKAADDGSDSSPTEPSFLPMKTPTEQHEHERPNLHTHSSNFKTEDDLFQALSRRKSAASVESKEEHDEIEKLMSRLFGKARQQSEEEKTRHSGVVFRNLTVKGVGLGASLQPTISDIFLDVPRFVKNLFTKGAKAATAKPPVRELLSDFDGCVRPGEMLLVLGRPGSGCTTFLKVFCNQRAGFEDVLGDVTYGGADAETMAKQFRGEIVRNISWLSTLETLKLTMIHRFIIQKTTCTTRLSTSGARSASPCRHEHPEKSRGWRARRARITSGSSSVPRLSCSGSSTRLIPRSETNSSGAYRVVSASVSALLRPLSPVPASRGGITRVKV